MICNRTWCYYWLYDDITCVDVILHYDIWCPYGFAKPRRSEGAAWGYALLFMQRNRASELHYGLTCNIIGLCQRNKDTNRLITCSSSRLCCTKQRNTYTYNMASHPHWATRRGLIELFGRQQSEFLGMARFDKCSPEWHVLLASKRTRRTPRIALAVAFVRLLLQSALGHLKHPHRTSHVVCPVRVDVSPFNQTLGKSHRGNAFAVVFAGGVRVLGTLFFDFL